MKPNMPKMIAARNLSFVKMSLGFSDVIWLALAMLKCGLTLALKSVRWRHAHWTAGFPSDPEVCVQLGPRKPCSGNTPRLSGRSLVLARVSCTHA